MTFEEHYHKVIFGITHNLGKYLLLVIQVGMFYVGGGTRGFNTQISKEIEPQTLLGMVFGKKCYYYYYFKWIHMCMHLYWVARYTR
jgi:hypothetical protein